MKSLTLVAGLFILFLAPAASASAGDDDDLSGSTSGIAVADVTVTLEVVRFLSVYANPQVDSERDHLQYSSSSVSRWPLSNSVHCSLSQAGYFDESSQTSVPSRCLERWVCGGERVDDVVSGDIAGEEASGRYAEFLDDIVGSAGAFSASGFADINSVSDLLLSAGLADDHEPGQIPVFYWCGKQLRDQSEVTFAALGVGNPARWPSFAWTTTIDDEYDIPAWRDDALVQLRSEIGLNKPELAAVPALVNGFTWVKWPTWLWVTSATAPVHVWDENDSGTARIDMRAVVDRVEWRFGGELLRVCSLDEMVAFDEAVHDPVADAPACVHRFADPAQGGELKATVFYRVEVKIRDRFENKNIPYPEVPWSPHPDDPRIELTTTVPDYGVREVYAVNTPIDMTDDEIAELLSTAGG